MRGISPTIVQHRIHLEDSAKPYQDRLRRLNPSLQEVVKKEVLNRLDHLVKNDKDELIPTRVQYGWTICIDYKKLNSSTRKDHFLYLFGPNAIEDSCTGFLLLSR